MKTGEHRTKSDGDTATAMEHSDITGPTLRKLFQRDRVVRPPQQLPTGAGFARLAASLNGLRALIAEYKGPMTEGTQREKAVGVAILTLREALPGLIVDIEAQLERTVITSSGEQSEYALVQARQWFRSLWLPGIEALRGLEAAVGGVDRYSHFWTPHYLPPLDRWHEFVHILAQDFSVAMGETNPRVSFGLSNKGPIARYCVLAIEQLTGNRTTTEAVARHLMRRATCPAP